VTGNRELRWIFSPRAFQLGVWLLTSEESLLLAFNHRDTEAQRGRAATKIFLQKKTKETKIGKNFAKSRK
jgi:hypothetical protein